MTILSPQLKGDFPTRNSLVAAIAAGWVPANGVTYTAAGIVYIGQTGATSIPDLPGLVPASNANTFLALSGSDVTPSYSFADDPSTGIYRAAAGVIGFSTNGSERLRLTTSGADFSGDVTVADRIIHSGDTNTSIRFPANDTFSVETNGVERVRVDSSGRIGMGTNSPGGRLDIVSAGSTDLNLISTGDNAIYRATATPTGLSYYAMGDSDDIFVGGLEYDHTSDTLRIHANNAERMRVASDGKLLHGINQDIQLGVSYPVQIGRNVDSGVTLAQWSTDGNGATLAFAKSRAATFGSRAVVSANDTVGRITFRADDGVSSQVRDVARISAEVDGTPGANDTPGRLTFSTTADGTAVAVERMRINNLGNVGIGTTTIDAKVAIRGSGDDAPCISITSGETFNNGSDVVPRVPVDGLMNFENGQLKIWPDLDGDGDYDADLWANGNMYLASAARIHLRSQIPASGGAGDDEGRLVIGATNETNYIQSAKNFSGSVRKDFAIGDYNSTAWWAYFDQSNGGWMGVGESEPNARLHVSDAAVTVGVFRSTGSANCRIGFRGTSQSDNTTATVGVDTSGRLVLRGTAQEILRIGSSALQAGADNSFTCGSASFRWSTVFAATGTINTSDERAKQDICELDEAELRVAKACKGLIRKYRWRDAVAEKGDTARWHFGVIAQDVVAAFEAEGLDPFAYGVVCYDEWDADGEREAGNRYGVRYDELLAFIIAAI